MICCIKWSKKNKEKTRTRVMTKVESYEESHATVYPNKDTYNDDDDAMNTMNTINLNTMDTTSSDFIINNPTSHLERSFTQSSEGYFLNDNSCISLLLLSRYT